MRRLTQFRLTRQLVASCRLLAAPVVDDHHLIEGLQIGLAVGDPQHGLVRAGGQVPPAQLGGASRVEVGGGLVEDQDRTVGQEGSGHTKALASPPEGLTPPSPGSVSSPWRRPAVQFHDQGVAFTS